MAYGWTPYLLTGSSSRSCWAGLEGGSLWDLTNIYILHVMLPLLDFEEVTVRQRPLYDTDSQFVSSTTLKRWYRNKSPGSPKELETTLVRPLTKLPADMRGREVTFSENHSWDRRANKPRGNGNVGGPFFTSKKSVRVTSPVNQTIFGRVQSSQSSSYWEEAEYTGPIFARSPGLAVYPESPELSKEDLEALGTTAIARCKPTNSVADVATFLAELVREGLPKLAGSTLWKEKTAAGLGGEYLNLEFGWKPVVSDVRDIISAISHARTVLDQYERGSGSLVRRRYDFPVSHSFSSEEISGSSSIPQTDPSFTTFGRAAKIVCQHETLSRVWFSGAFTYHLPTGYRSRNALEKLGAQANALLGVDLTPEVLWNATPWSWAVDWFSNAGDVISNLSDYATDGLVMQWGYVMEHCSATNSYFALDRGLAQSSDVWDKPILGSPVVASVETKQRTMASPFGFGIDDGALTARQKAIIAALGLSRQKRL